MDDERGDLLGPPDCTTPAAVIANKIQRFDAEFILKTDCCLYIFFRAIQTSHTL